MGSIVLFRYNQKAPHEEDTTKQRKMYNMEHSTATLDDRIIDIATLAAIHAAEDDYPRFLSTKALAQAADLKAHEAISNFSSDNGTPSTILYVGVFTAAYHLRSRSLVERPTDSHHTSL
jgi:hypothetical protein